MDNNNGNNNNDLHIPTNELKIISWNAAGIINKLTELECYIHQNDIDVVVMSETHLTDADTIEIDGYYVYTANHPANTRSGGSAVIINQNIEHTTLPTLITQALQCTPVCISFAGQSLLNLVAAYLPPSQRKPSNQDLTLLATGMPNTLGGVILVPAIGTMSSLLASGPTITTFLPLHYWAKSEK
ncbi:hypothetical protein ACLKA7_000010 [Drosophila subpalustris]